MLYLLLVICISLYACNENKILLHTVVYVYIFPNYIYNYSKVLDNFTQFYTNLAVSCLD